MPKTLHVVLDFGYNDDEDVEFDMRTYGRGLNVKQERYTQMGVQYVKVSSPFRSDLVKYVGQFLGGAAWYGAMAATVVAEQLLEQEMEATK